MAEETKNKRTRKKSAPKEVVEEVVKVETEAPVKVEKTKAEEPKVNAEAEALKEQNELLRQQIEELKKQMSAAPQPQVIQITADTEMIDFLWLAPVADDNELQIADGLFGKITGKVGNFSVPKKDFSRMLDSATRKFIENRWLIVLGGFTDNERIQYGVDYKPGEVLDKDVFLRLLDYGELIVPIYEKLCDASKDVVSKLYYEAYMEPSKKAKVKRETVVAMHKIAPRPALKAIIDGMNAEDAQ